MEPEETLPSPKKLCLDIDEDQFVEPVRRDRCSTPIPITSQQLSTEELETLGISNTSFESFIEDVEEDEAVLDLSQHGLDDQSFSEFLDDVENESKGESDITVDYSNYEQVDGGGEMEGMVFPPEILENVLCRLPFVDLFTSVRLVCKLWNRMIARESPKCFIKWKVAYYKQRLQSEPPALSDRCLFNTHLDYKGFKNVLEVASYVKKEFAHVKSCLKNTLRKHEQYTCVRVLADSLWETGALSDLEELVVLVVSCHGVHQLLHLVTLLTIPVSGGFSDPCLTFMEVSEIFYCLATLFLVYLNKEKLPPRFHYNVFYVLDVMERNATPTYSRPEDQPDTATTHQIAATASKEKLTSEQLRIINHSFQPGQTVKVIALAGTGKTTTLYHFTQLNPDIRFLYCVYNKSVQQYAETIIFSGCRNVEAKTLHALAYRNTGYSYSNMRKLGSDLNATFISWNLQTTTSSFESRMALANLVKETLKDYFASSNEEITVEHISGISSKFSRATILNEARSYWQQMKSLDQKDFKVKMTHDGYLKLYQLQKPKDLSRRYDMILVDEAQDLTPAVIDILTEQEITKMFVGDPNQQIYSFRGASNAFKQVEASHTYHLTRSFRFGPEISYATALALRYFKCSEGQFLVGNTEKGSIEGFTQTGQVAIISRLNTTLFDEIVKIIKNKPTARIGFTGTLRMSDLNTKYGFTLLEDILALKNGTNVRHLQSSELKWSYKSYDDLRRRAEKTEDKSLLGRIHVCQKYGGQIPTLLKSIRERTTFDLEEADFVFSTAHRSKGLEFDTVKVSDDFTPEFKVAVYGPFGDELECLAVEEDERNLAYVAMTRAKHHLVLSQAILDVLKKNGESFDFPTTVKGKMIECNRCGDNISSSLFLKTQGFCLNNDEEVAGSVVCRYCSQMPVWL